MHKKLKASRNLTKVLIWMNIFYLFGTVPRIILFIFSEVYKAFHPILDLLYSIANILSMLMRGSYIVVYYRFNKVFRKTLNQYLSEIKNFGSFKKNK